VSAFEQRAERRLREELIVWLVTVNPKGTPQPSPVWFLWEGASILLYSRPGKPKLRNIERNPRVALHLDSDGTGGDIVVMTGAARVSDDPPASEIPAYIEKYRGRIERNGWTPQSFAADYSIPVRVEVERLRGF